MGLSTYFNTKLRKSKERGMVARKHKERLRIITIWHLCLVIKQNKTRSIYYKEDSSFIAGSVLFVLWLSVCFLPKSASFSSPLSLMRRFWGFRSLWRIFLLWQYERPRSSWNIKIYKKETGTFHKELMLQVKKTPTFSKLSEHVSWKSQIYHTTVSFQNVQYLLTKCMDDILQ